MGRHKTRNYILVQSQLVFMYFSGGSSPDSLMDRDGNDQDEYVSFWKSKELGQNKSIGPKVRKWIKEGHFYMLSRIGQWPPF